MEGSTDKLCLLCWFMLLFIHIITSQVNLSTLVTSASSKWSYCSSCESIRKKTSVLLALLLLCLVMVCGVKMNNAEVLPSFCTLQQISCTVGFVSPSPQMLWVLIQPQYTFPGWAGQISKATEFPRSLNRQSHNQSIKGNYYRGNYKLPLTLPVCRCTLVWVGPLHPHTASFQYLPVSMKKNLCPKSEKEYIDIKRCHPRYYSDHFVFTLK